MAAHDIRNPVGSIKMIAEMFLEKKEVSDESRSWIKMVEAAATNSLQILNDTLNISKIHSGTINLNKSKVDYIKFIQDCVLANQFLAHQKEQNIVFESTIDQIEVNFDASRFSQVVNNLLTNAIKYSNTNTTIIVRVSFYDAEKSKILTNIIDQGLGIDEEYHATLFDPFVTTSNKPTSNESSTGLGLAIVKKIVELHQGTIEFTSEKDKGSNFFFTIPIA
jgi:signal transduction histidine kinase